MTIHIPRKKKIHMLRPVKDNLCLNVPGVYRIKCECDTLDRLEGPLRLDVKST